MTVAEWIEVAANRRRLARRCGGWLRDSALVQDAVQETILIALRKDSDRSGEEVEAWVAGVARNVCRTLNRSRSHEPETDVAVDPFELALDFERERLLGAALAALSPQMRSLLMARYLDDVPVAELAERAGASPNAMSARLLRARRALAEGVLGTEFEALAQETGLIATPEDQGVASGVWCMRCGVRRMRAFASASGWSFRCLSCDVDGGLDMLSTDHPATELPEWGLGQADPTAVGRGLIEWWRDFVTKAHANGRCSCPACGSEATVSIRSFDRRSRPGVWFRCSSCGFRDGMATPGLLVHSFEGQAFWERHARVTHLSTRRRRIDGRPVEVATFRAVDSAETIRQVYDIETLRRVS